MNDRPDWEPRVEKVEAAVSELKTALLGSLDGRPGLRSQIEILTQVVQRNTTLNERNAEQLEALRLDRAKVVGIIVTVAAVMGLIYKLFLK